MDAKSSWAMYTRLLMSKLDMSESEMARRAHVQQGTLNRWRNGKSAPDKAADVADFARLLGRNPLEAFVAATMLDIEEAGAGLSAEARDTLNDVRQMVRRADRIARTVERKMSGFHESLLEAANDARDGEPLSGEGTDSAE